MKGSNTYFRPSSQIDLIIGETRHSRNVRPKTATNEGRPPITKKKQRTFHTISTRIGEIAFNEPEDNLAISKSTHPSTPREEEIIFEVYEPEKPQYQTFLTLPVLKSINPRNIVPILENNPLFLKTMYTDGCLDQEIIGSISVSLTPTEFSKLLINMTQEINFYNSITQCTSFDEIEKIVMKTMPVTNVIIWEKIFDSEYLLSNSLKQIINIHDSIIGYSLLHNQDIIVGDPGNHPGFNLEYDMQLLRGSESLIVLPLFNISNQQCGVIQIYGMKDTITNKQIPFPSYYVEVMKVCRNMIKQSFFKPICSKSIPHTISSIFTLMNEKNYKIIIQKIIKYLQDYIPCDVAEIYLFDDRHKRLINQLTLKEYDETTGGVSFAAGMISEPINIPHNKKHPAFNNDIDGVLNNRSILSMSVLYGHYHFVITLRAKWRSPSFVEQDLHLLKLIIPLLGDSLNTVNHVVKSISDLKMMKRHSYRINEECQSIDTFVGNTKDPWTIFKDIGKKYFGSNSCLVVIFDGRMMNYHPGNIKRKLNECLAGEAFNFRELRWNENDGKYPMDLYNELKIRLEKSAAFPFRSNGRVVGAIELINPDYDAEVDEEGRLLIGSIASFLFPQIQDVIV